MVAISRASADADGGMKMVLDRAVSAIAKDGEILPFEKDFEIKGAVETWLNECTEHMKQQLRLLLDRALGASR